MFMFTFVGVLLVIGIVAITVWKSRHAAYVERIKLKAQSQNWDEEKIASLVQAEAFPVPNWSRAGLSVLAALAFGAGLFHSVWFYAEPGYIYHIRTITGEERVIEGTGYTYYLFGRYNSWKRAMTVQSTITSAKSGAEGELDSVGSR